MRLPIVAACLLAYAASAAAQPFIIPLEGDSHKPTAPEASAPPVAPPQAGPSIPNNVAETQSDQGRPEVATVSTPPKP